MNYIVKGMILAVALSGAAGQAKAQSNAEILCASSGQLAVDALEARQRGIPLNQALGTANDLPDGIVGLYRRIIIRAYDLPIEGNKQAQVQQSANLRNDVEHDCLNGTQ